MFNDYPRNFKREKFSLSVTCFVKHNRNDDRNHASDYFKVRSFAKSKRNEDFRFRL